MATDFEQGVTKTIDLTVKAANLTSDVLKSAMQDFLSGLSEKKGKVSMKEIEKKSNGQLESIEITDSNIRDFLETAKKYDVDYALKRDSGTQPQTYHVFFQTSKADNFKRAFSEYAARKQEDISKPQRGEFTRAQLKQQAQSIAAQPRKKEKIRERANEVSH